MTMLADVGVRISYALCEKGRDVGCIGNASRFMICPVRVLGAVAC